MQISLTPEDFYQDRICIYPSAASFPDLDLRIPTDPGPRQRLASMSEPDLSRVGCHHSIRNRWRRWTNAFRSWSVQDILGTVQSEEGGEEDRGEATPP